ncbi:MAG TPA: ABC transporter ATP-binding protein [Thermoanaerobaculia bacterium]|jgi:ABC-2 type transport system ATP-binding protein|nr:ABC transporter ATP-binding protein [Thermoanaerobaculia bacterium]
MAAIPIEAQGLRKVYRARFRGRSVAALDGLDLRVEPGEVFGLLGPNGAGKTTTVKILLGLTRPSAGSARLFGRPASDPRSRRRVGYLPEGHRFPGYLTARQTLSIFGRMSGVDAATLSRRIPALLERVRLTDWTDVRVKKYSKGMTQRLGLAAALVHDPDVLLLDEPTDGVDPVGRREIRDLLQEEAARGKAILLNSHLLSEIERMCSRVAVLRAGRVAAEGRIEDLTAGGTTYRLVASGVDERLLAAFRETGASIERINGHFDLTARDVDHLNALVDRLRSSGAKLQELSPVRASLEDVFVGLVRDADPGRQAQP